MPSTRQIRQRIRSVASTARITNAMQMIAAAKMRRAQQRVLASRPYSTKLIEFLGGLVQRQSSAGAQDLHPLMEVREARNASVILVTPDRGLCGGLNTNLNRTSVQFALEQESSLSYVTVGKKGYDFTSRLGREIRAEFTNLGDFPEPLDQVVGEGVVVIEHEDHGEWSGGSYFFAAERCFWKNSVRIVPHSCSSTPPMTTERWLSRSSLVMAYSDWQPPPLGSAAPNSTVGSRACTIAPAHIGLHYFCALRLTSGPTRP